MVFSKNRIILRFLRLNCLTDYFSELWSDLWKKDYQSEQWTIKDKRLSPWNELSRYWDKNTPLRNYFERRQALVEIDVLSSFTLHLMK